MSLETLAMPSLFDAAESVRQRDAGIALAADHAGSVLFRVQEIARELGRRHGFVTADDVQREMAAHNIKSKELGNGAGSMFRGRDQWRDTGRVVKSECIAAHARKITVWEYIGK